MALVLNEEQILLRESASGFLKEKSPVSALRKLRDTKDGDGFSRPLWAQMAEMGWPAIAVPENYGGLGYGFVGAGLVLEEMGRTLTASPMLSTAILGVHLFSNLGSEEQKEMFLPAIAEGSLLTALAIDEGPHHQPSLIKTTAKKEGNGYILSGEKSMVLDGHVADQLIVVARTSSEDNACQGITLFVVPKSASGMSIERTVMIDSRNAAQIRFDNVALDGSHILGTLDEGFAGCEKALDVACACLAAEMLGAARESFERTVAYLKEREQFGVKIGSFQSLQHRAAHMFSELELAQSVVTKALMAIDEGDPNLAYFASIAKAKLIEVSQLVTDEALQMHGGIGMADEFDIGLFMKRVNAAAPTFGDYSYHADRVAKIKGY